MKKFTLLTMLVMLFTVTTFAQNDMKMRPIERALSAPSTISKGIDRRAQTANRAVSRAVNDLVTPPPTATVETWYRVGGNYYIYSYDE
jgi:hypothetical protein